MSLVASLIVRNELGRFLEPCVRHLQAFCDEIRVLDDCSDDGTYEWLSEQQGVHVKMTPKRPRMFEHEGQARQRLLDWTLKAKPDWILAIDADEFVSDGQTLRAAVERPNPHGVFNVTLSEVWKASESGLAIRVDGGWKPHRCPILFAAKPGLRISQRQLACGREPISVRHAARHAPDSGVGVLHVGWVNELRRPDRYQRYVAADNGRFHASQHLRSIMWPDRRVRMRWEQWPDGLLPWRDQILAGCGPVAVA